ncbi:SUMF1/EgtB/PvdO family nonheme iron enzyme [Candidatus Poribacteria bacterium]|nr:SUMF1/EgtB/PvdO family nonheme iron enzyme [Candidatus Poribacteria bacterium]
MRNKLALFSVFLIFLITFFIIITNANVPVFNTKVDSVTPKVVRDDSPMVLIPAGEFQMGSESGGDDEKPVHIVYLDDFYIDKYEVTNARYKKFLDETDHREPGYWKDPNYNSPDHPVVGISWEDARAFCKWAGKRLPTEAEWEKAARGGLVGKKYPWGDEIDHDKANYYGTGGKDKWEYTSPVGSFPPNEYGLFDMAGNVWEWCADVYDSKYYSVSEKKNPKGPESGVFRVLRGGGWIPNDVEHLRVSYRGALKQTQSHCGFGFRCVK